MRSKVCTKCNREVGLSGFYKKKEAKDGLHSHCKECRNKYRATRPRSSNYKQTNLEYYYRNKEKWSAIKARRRAQKLNATPQWADKEKIDFIYHCRGVLNKLTKGDWEVDHVIPLQNDKVCGLHVHQNLRVIPKIDNRKKSNKFSV